MECMAYMEHMETLVGAIIGAVAALVGTWFSTWRSARVQMDTTVINTILPVRLEAYRQFEVAIEEWNKSMTQEASAAAYRAGNSIVLVASDHTIGALAAVLNSIHEFETTGTPINEKQFRANHLRLLKAMNRDLMYIQAPKIEKKKPQDRKENQRNTTN